MELTAVQQDALIELLNIGFGRAAASLSQLTGHRVLLEVPQVSHPSDRRGRRRARARGPAARSPACTRSSSGPVAGDALLMLDHARRRRC